MIALLLVQKIASLFMIMAVGFALVRSGVLKPDASGVISKVMLYGVAPCSVIAAYQVELTQEVLLGFGLAMAVGAAVQLLLMVAAELVARPLRLSGLEKMTSVYSNTFNLILPLVTFCLGGQWCIYALAYMTVQTVMMWTHGKALIEGKPHIEWKKLLLDINIIALAAGFVMFISGLRLGGPVLVFVNDMASLLGPIAMLLTGTIVGDMHLPDVVTNKRVWLVAALRLVLMPGLACVLLKVAAGLGAGLPVDLFSILMITMMAVATPSASMSVVFSTEYGTEAPYASSINIVTMLLCIVAMPLWVFLYTL